VISALADWGRNADADAGLVPAGGLREGRGWHAPAG
jgi:hypothetical protein